MAQGETPGGYLPPPPTHPTYGYQTPEEVAELEAGERERSVAKQPGARRADGAEAVFLPTTPPVSAPSEPAPEHPGGATFETEAEPAAVSVVVPAAVPVTEPAAAPAAVSEADSASETARETESEIAAEDVTAEGSDLGPGSPTAQWGTARWQQEQTPATEQWPQQPGPQQHEAQPEVRQPDAPPASQSQYGDHVWDQYQRNGVPRGQQIPVAPQPASRSYEQWEPARAAPDTTAYTWQGANGELYVWDGQQWVLQEPAHGQPTLGQPMLGPQSEQPLEQAAQQTGADYTWDGPDGEHYVWNGWEWVLTHPGHVAAAAQVQQEPRKQVDSLGELVWTWEGADGETYHWDPRLEQWMPRGHPSR